MMCNDFFGNMIEIGDVVAITAGASLQKGTVVSIDGNVVLIGIDDKLHSKRAVDTVVDVRNQDARKAVEYHSENLPS